MKYLDDVRQWDTYLHPPAGSEIGRTAELTIEHLRRNRDSRIIGLVFNDVVIRIGTDDTVNTVCQRYAKECQPRK